MRSKVDETMVSTIHTLHIGPWQLVVWCGNNSARADLKGLKIASELRENSTN